MKLFNSLLVFVMCGILAVPMTGCTVSQTKINTAVTDIGNWTPVITSDATALLTDIASFSPSDAATLNSFVSTMNTDAAALTTLCKQYLASPSSSVMAQISQTVTALATTDSQGLLAVAQVKDANSQKIAQGILVTIATAVTILSGYLSTINVSTPVTTTASADRWTLQSEFAKAQTQGLIPQSMTFAKTGF